MSTTTTKPASKPATKVDGSKGFAAPSEGGPFKMLPAVELPIKGYWKTCLANEAFVWTRSAMWQIEMVLLTDLLGTLPKTDIFGDHVANQLAKHIKDHRLEDVELSEEDARKVGAQDKLAVDNVENQGWTKHPSVDDKYCMLNYQIKGFLKESARLLKSTEKNGKFSCDDAVALAEEEQRTGKKKPETAEIKQLKSRINNYCFVEPWNYDEIEGSSAEDALRRKAIFLLKPNGQDFYLTDDEPLDVNIRPLIAQTMQGVRTAISKSDVIPAGTRIRFRLKVAKGGEVGESFLQKVLAYAECQGFLQWRNAGYGRARTVQCEQLS